MQWDLHIDIFGVVNSLSELTILQSLQYIKFGWKSAKMPSNVQGELKFCIEVINYRIVSSRQKGILHLIPYCVLHFTSTKINVA